MTSLIAAQKPHWKPGSMHGYHAHTIGYAAGELISRVDPLHRSYGQFIRDEFDREFYVGIPDNRLEQRISPLLQKEVIVLTEMTLFLSTLSFRLIQPMIFQKILK